jgi:hypothetical protein
MQRLSTVIFLLQPHFTKCSVQASLGEVRTAKQSARNSVTQDSELLADSPESVVKQTAQCKVTLRSDTVSTVRGCKQTNKTSEGYLRIGQYLYWQPKGSRSGALQQGGLQTCVLFSSYVQRSRFAAACCLTEQVVCLFVRVGSGTSGTAAHNEARKSRNGLQVPAY